MKRWIFGWLLILLSAPVYAQVLTGPGTQLDVLQKIQGRWRSDCHPVEAGPRYGYQRINLTVNFTHFKFSVDEFPSAECATPRSTTESRFRFALREPIVARDGTPAFAIDFAADGAVKMNLYPLNIIHYKAGTLRLGEPPVVEIEDRLQELDRELIFKR
ncbi:hypothetical protein DWB84_15000 [Saccharophagus sp. K07]|uniref:hypothetical protein n=1 Tax=Saccharophagus sp. K07 TaxID=2283636 RepID=UPI0016523BB1|nr:hypothetical protein [Saccharophagus sp. K07]MBC6906759.1 hypothetical protein [Saccharophagus sp. K07]